MSDQRDEDHGCLMAPLKALDFIVAFMKYVGVPLVGVGFGAVLASYAVAMVWAALEWPGLWWAMGIGVALGMALGGWIGIAAAIDEWRKEQWLAERQNRQ